MRTFRLAPTLLVVLLASCTDEPLATIRPTDAAPSMNTVSRITVFGGGGTYYAGTSTTMSAQAYDANNNVIYNAPLYWSSSNTSVAWLGGHGSPVTVNFASPGNATIAVSSGGVVGYTTVQVLAQPVVTSVTISPSPVDIALGGTQQLTAKAYDQHGNPITGGARTWSSANSSIASVSSNGVVTGNGPGNTTVQVTVDGVSATVPITVARLKVTLSGTNYVMSDGTYTWSATATGGTGSYSYNWSVEWPYSSNTVSLGGASSQSMWVDSSSDTMFIMHVTVTSGSQTATTLLTVCNFIMGMSC